MHITYDSYGRAVGGSDGSGSHSQAFDDGNLTTSVTTTYTGLPAQTIGYAYYPNASHQSMTTPAGAQHELLLGCQEGCWSIKF